MKWSARLGSRATLVTVAVLGGILLLVAILYLPVLGFPFLSLDDHYGVETNPGIRDLSWRGVRFLFFEDQRDWRYFPLAYLSFAIDAAWFGVTPAAMHRTNLALHLANTALVFALVRTLSRDGLVAAVASLLFGIHPLQVETVAWVSSRKTVLFTTFYLLATLAYVGHARAAPARRSRSAALLAASVLLFFLSMLAKPTAISLPAVLLLIDFALAAETPRRPIAFAWRHLPSKLLYLPAIAFVLEMTRRLSRPSPMGRDFDFGVVEWAAIVGHNVFFYVAKALAPIHLGVFYPLPNDGPGGLPLRFYAFALLGVALIACWIWSFFRSRWVFFGLGWYLATLAPNAIQPAFFHDPPLLAADRYFYQSAVGLFFLVGLGFAHAWRRWSAARVGLALAGAAACASLVVASRAHVQAFRGVIPLYEQTLAHHPSDAFYYRLALEYAGADRQSSAFGALELAERAPSQVFFGDLFVFQMQLSDLYRRKGDPAKAAEFLARAIDATPNAIEPARAQTPLAYRYLASLYEQAGDSARANEARAAAETAAVDPSHYFESNWLVLAPDAALPFLEKRVREAPGDAIAWYYLGRGLHLYGQDERAAECLTRAKALGFPP